MQWLRRVVLGSIYVLMPERIGLLPRILMLSIASMLAPESERNRLPEHPSYYSKRGLVGISDDLSVPALVANYSRGFFPVCHLGPMKWWCPEDRAVIDPAETHASKNLRRLIRQHRFTVTMDHDFAGVMQACAAPRPGKVPLTWITPRVMRAYWDAYEAGYAHSVEVWDEAGRLVGGLYGLAIGKVFFGESQFSAVEHASKIALVALHRHLAAWGYHLRDGKWMTPHLASFGFKPMPRDAFQALVAAHVGEPGNVGRWAVDPALDLADETVSSGTLKPAPRKVA
ncbi:MAG: leucyl/phenylalanyl-tRNA--protein transferase [Methyloceanibacter sp.]|uniref:leucyl/phenylalanyl-tRNA--protein transferase n=1 Tax=Methyloceanibacter sp. TaxID=1965321 RepID=UPI003D6D6AE1